MSDSRSGTAVSGEDAPKKSITFLNAARHYEVLKAADVDYPLSAMILAQTDRGELTFYTGISTGPGSVKLEPIPGSTQKESAAFYTDLFQKSHTVILPDSMFTAESMLLDTDTFVSEGLCPLQEFFRGGGKVVVVCVEGIYAIGDVLSSSFGSNWRLGQITDHDSIVTERGRNLLGSRVNAPKVHLRKGHFMETPANDGIYGIFTPDFEAYLEENYGGDADEEDREDAKQSWKRQASLNQSNFAIAIHKDTESQGNLVWFGDRSMKSELIPVFAMLLRPEIRIE